MKTRAIVFCLLSSVSVFAQNYVGLTSGVNFSSVVNMPVKVKILPRFSGGITFEHFFRETFSMEADLTYLQRGYKLNFQSNQSQQNGFIKVNIDYVALPIKATFFLGGTRQFFISGGIVPSIYINGNTVMDPAPNGSPAKVKIEEGSFTEFDFGLMAEGGWRYPISDTLSFFGSLSLIQSLIDLSPNGSGAYNFGGVLSVGIKKKVGG